MLWNATTPGSAAWSNGSTVCMIGGGGILPANMARTKSSPDIEAITSSGVTPYSILGVGWSPIGAIPGIWIYDYGYHTKRFAQMPVLPNSFRVMAGLRPGHARPAPTERA